MFISNVNQGVSNLKHWYASETLCRAKEARHRKAHIVGFHVYEALEQAKLIYGDKNYNGCL